MIGDNVQLFVGIKFWFTHRLPARSHYIDLVRGQGGEVVPIDKYADIKIADHLKKDAPADSISYKWIDQSIKDGELAPKAPHSTSPLNIVRTAGPANNRQRHPFTPQDDAYLLTFLKRAAIEGRALLGNAIYKVLEEENPRHTLQSWRDRYNKFYRHIDLLQAARDEDMVPSAPALSVRTPSHRASTGVSTQQRVPDTEARNPRTNPPSQVSGQAEINDPASDAHPDRPSFSDEDYKDLMESCSFILEVSAQTYLEGWRAKAEHDGRHTAAEWQFFFENYVKKDYEKQKLKETQKASTAAEREVTETRDLVAKIAEASAQNTADREAPGSTREGSPKGYPRPSDTGSSSLPQTTNNEAPLYQEAGEPRSIGEVAKHLDVSRNSADSDRDLAHASPEDHFLGFSAFRKKKMPSLQAQNRGLSYGEYVRQLKADWAQLGAEKRARYAKKDTRVVSDSAGSDSLAYSKRPAEESETEQPAKKLKASDDVQLVTDKEPAPDETLSPAIALDAGDRDEQMPISRDENDLLAQFTTLSPDLARSVDKAVLGASTLGTTGVNQARADANPTFNLQQFAPPTPSQGWPSTVASSQVMLRIELDRSQSQPMNDSSNIARNDESDEDEINLDFGVPDPVDLLDDELDEAEDDVFNVPNDVSPQEARLPRVSQPSQISQNPVSYTPTSAQPPREVDTTQTESSGTTTASGPSQSQWQHQAPTHAVPASTFRPRGRKWDTQALDAAETQQIDFAVPLPDEDYDMDDGNDNNEIRNANDHVQYRDDADVRSSDRSSPPPSRQSSASPPPRPYHKPSHHENNANNRTSDKQDRKQNKEIAISDMMRLPNGLLALKATSFRPAIAQRVLDRLQHSNGTGAGKIPENMRGVWTVQDDRDLESNDGQRLARVGKKHGWEGPGGIRARNAHMSKFRKLEKATRGSRIV